MPTVSLVRGTRRSEANALLAAGYGAVIASEEDPTRPLNTLELKA